MSSMSFALNFRNYSRESIRGANKVKSKITLKKTMQLFAIKKISTYPKMLLSRCCIDVIPVDLEKASQIVLDYVNKQPMKSGSWLV